MFGLCKEKEWKQFEASDLRVVNAPVLIEGKQEFETLCPVNPLTGHRDSPITILRYALTDKNKGLLDKVLVELPTIKQMDVSDEIKLDTLVSALDIQSQTDRDIVAKELLSISDVLLDKGIIDSSESVKSDNINFAGTESPQDANI